MAQLATAARPAKTARQLKNIREIRKVKGAIVWHERQREKSQKIVRERQDDKLAYRQMNRWHIDNVVKPIKIARKNLKEDYELGPLRPNRAVGVDAEKYGVLGLEGLRRAPIPLDTHKRRNEARIARGLDPIAPLIAEDKKFFPIAVDDRVMVMKGREQGKIGKVSQVYSDTHQVVVKDMNMHYTDGSLYVSSDGEVPDAKRVTEVPFALEDVRLVIPYRLATKDQDGNEKYLWTDVVVDNIVMERHTTGIDPFTKIDYGTREFPEEHRFDPETGLPIFNRYIAGTRKRIQWPWETELPEEEHDELLDPSSQPNESLLGKTKSLLKSPIKKLASTFRKPKEEAVPEEPKKTDEELERERFISKVEQTNRVPELPRGPPARLPMDYDDDTGRNMAEPSRSTSSFYPTIVRRPFPREIAPEIEQHAKEVEQDERSEKQDWYDDKKEITPEERAERKAAKLEKLKKKKGLPAKMKTPLQLRWEVQRREQMAAKEATKVDRDALMLALGAHMAAKQAERRTTKPEPEPELD